MEVEPSIVDGGDYSKKVFKCCSTQGRRGGKIQRTNVLLKKIGIKEEDE
jgi:hypothetical protein